MLIRLYFIFIFPLLLIGAIIEFALMVGLLVLGLVIFCICFIPFGIKNNPANYLWKIFDYYQDIECYEYMTFCGKYRYLLWRKTVDEDYPS